MNRRKVVVVLIAVAFVAICISAYFVIFEKENGKEILSNNLDVSTLQVYTIKYEINNAESITSTMSSCLVINEICSVTTPNIQAKNGYKVIGWATDSSSNEKKYDVNEKINIKSDMILYAVTIKNSDLVTKYNIDNTCNLNKYNTDIAIVDIAYSQIGYVEKKSNNNLDSCTENKGNDNYNKYGNLGNAWGPAFINWVFEKVDINLLEKGITDVYDVDSYVLWAKSKNRWYTSKSSLHNGDLAIADGSIGIVVKEGNIWKMITGNRDNEVKLVELYNVIGFINMASIVY